MPVKCMICGKEFEKSVAGSHLTVKHQITAEEYKKWFPDAELYTKEHAEYLAGVSKRAESANVERIKRLKERKAKPKDERKEELIIDKSPTILEPYKVPNFEFIENYEKEEKPVLYKNSRENTQVDKLQILSYLDNIFPGCAVENNFVAEKRSVYGDMIYRIQTDISIPALKIDFEFPNSYWRCVGDNFYRRDIVLPDDGWTVIIITSKNPTVGDVVEALEKNEIIPG